MARFQKRVKPAPLHVGDLVLKVIRGLIRDPRGKFRPNWSGPYFIRELTPKGAAWLMDLDGNRFSEPTNVDQLKRFMDPHGLARSSLTGCSPRRGHDRYLTEPLRSTQPGPHFSTLGCHHASPSGRYILDMCVTCAMTDDFMTFVLRTVTPMPSWDIFQPSNRFIPFDIVVWSCLWCLDFPRHHFRGVHIRSITRPIGVILGSSGQIGYI
ncbi:hypothetical protein AAG906_029728 [Vitis piasezkii]